MGFSLDAPPGGGRVYDYKLRVKSPGCEQSGWDIDTQYISNTSYSKKIVYISINNKRESEWDGCDFLFLNTLYINRGGGVWRSIRGIFLIFGEILRAYKHHTETKEMQSLSIQRVRINNSTERLMQVFFLSFTCVKRFLWEEAVEIGEPNDPNDGTAQCNHHLFLETQSETHSQTIKRGIRLYFASRRNYQHWSTLVWGNNWAKAEQRVIEVCV